MHTKLTIIHAKFGNCVQKLNSKERASFYVHKSYKSLAETRAENLVRSVEELDELSVWVDLMHLYCLPTRGHREELIWAQNVTR